jgi:hypothetical protein
MQLWTDFVGGTACHPTYRQGDTFSSSQFAVPAIVLVLVLETLRDVAPGIREPVLSVFVPKGFIGLIPKGLKD